MRLLSFLWITALFFVSSCKKKSEDDNPVVTIISPLPNAAFSSGDTMRITINAIDNVDLHEMKMELKDGNTTLVAAYPYVHAKKSYTLDTLVTLPVVIAQKSLTIRSEAKDHDDNKGAAEITIQVNP